MVCGWCCSQAMRIAGEIQTQPSMHYDTIMGVPPFFDASMPGKTDFS